MGKVISSAYRRWASFRVTAKARRDLIVLGVTIAAVMLLIWNGSAFFGRLRLAEQYYGPGLKVAYTALTLNLALILFGWRRYIDLQHEAERRLEGERMAHALATSDTVTGLYNRRGFCGEGMRVAALDAERGGGGWLTLLSVQIDRFRLVNERHGYEVGDAVLEQVASRIAGAAGANTFLARVGGDEFAIGLTRGEDERDGSERCAADVLRSLAQPVEACGKIIDLGGFCGMAEAPLATIHLPELMRRAEIATDHARSGRIGRPLWFDSGMEEALIAHGELEQAIRFAVEQDQFIPYFEPQVDLWSGEIVGFEALARWDHPLSGILPPAHFLAAAEEMGLVGRLSDQVARKALTVAAGWDAAIGISINVSPAQLADSWLAQRIVRLLAETGFPAERLTVEITESTLFADMDLARVIVTSLKNQGIKVALDDFGSGFSSLSHLRTLPFDMIKIDRSFVSEMVTERESEAIVRAVTTLAQALHVPVTAEGIEDAATHQAAARRGCGFGQGWFFGKPMSAEAAAHLVARREVLGTDHPIKKSSAAR